MQDHGGDIDSAIRRFGGLRREWIDLSTGINRVPYPIPELSPDLWHSLPTRAEIDGLHRAAQQAYRTNAPLLALAGAQAAIQLVPRLAKPGLARVLAPTYNEHAAALRALGWNVEEVRTLDALTGADLAVIVNPNNPDGRRHRPEQLRAIARDVDRLIVDESFADPTPELSVAAYAGEQGLVVLRSFGKFYGLAGLRLGFALASAHDIALLSQLAGPWPVSGAAIAIGAQALGDAAWRDAAFARLGEDAARMDVLAERVGWRQIGGTHLFRLYETQGAAAVQDLLARCYIWSRIFPWSKSFVRLGLPGDEQEWARLKSALDQ